LAQFSGVSTGTSLGKGITGGHVDKKKPDDDEERACDKYFPLLSDDCHRIKDFVNKQTHFKIIRLSIEKGRTLLMKAELK
jgi:hypothetical protein